MTNRGNKPDQTARIQLPHGTGSVLFLGDDGEAFQSLVKVLELQGRRVFVATTGAEALDRLPGVPRPCLVLLDTRRQQLTGRQFYQLLAQPDVAVTALPDALLATGDSAADRLSRVDNIDVLIKTVERYCK